MNLFKQMVIPVLAVSLFAVTGGPVFAGKPVSTLNAPTLSASAISSGQIRLIWSDLNTNESGYSLERALTSSGQWSAIYVSGNSITTYTDSGLSPATTYYYRARAFKGGKRKTYSTYSPVVSAATLLPDSIAPSVTITSPQGASAVTGTVSVIVEASDNVGIANVELYVDGTLLGTSTQAPYIFSWDTTTFDQAVSHTLTAKAYDATGNVGTSAEVLISIQDTIIPWTELYNPANGQRVFGDVRVVGEAIDNVGITKIEIYIDNSLVATLTGSSYSYLWNTSALAVGSKHVIQSKAYDAAGNTGNSSAIHVAIIEQPEQIPPSVPVGLTATADASTMVHLSWQPSIDTGGSGLQGYVIYRNGEAILSVFQPDTDIYDNTVAPSTTYTYTVSASDNAGNQSAQSLPVSVTTPSFSEPDTIAPSMPTGLTALSTSGKVELSWNQSTDNVGGLGVWGYFIYRNGLFFAQTFLGPEATTFVDIAVDSQQTYSYTVSAFDYAGNQSPQTSPITVTSQ